jgi:hypothetical protein
MMGRRGEGLLLGDVGRLSCCGQVRRRLAAVRQSRAAVAREWKKAGLLGGERKIYRYF